MISLKMSNSKVMLVWARVNLLFFILASLALCFGFVLKRMLIVQGCFYFCCAVLTQRRSEVHKQLGEDSWFQLIKEISHTMALCPAYKLGGEGKERYLKWCHLSFQVTYDGALLFWGQLGTCLTMGVVVNELNIFICLHARLLLCLLKCVHLNPWVYSSLLFQFSPHPTAGEWTSSCVRLSFHLGLNQEKTKISCGESCLWILLIFLWSLLKSCRDEWGKVVASSTWMEPMRKIGAIYKDMWQDTWEYLQTERQ